MKKSILALGAVAALGGLGFASSAHAIAFFGADPAVDTANAADVLALNPGATGHMLFTPYYSAQGTTATMFNITNTDTVGKAVKVRFRSASNSDDVLDFTVFLSPGDVWAASLSKGSDGLGRVKTSDKSCTLPAQDSGGWPVSLNTQRLPGYLDAATNAINANEGYIEVLNMANIPAGSELYTNIKHVDGVAPCDSAKFATLLSTTVTEAAGAKAAGLAAPTGGLMGTWALFKQDELATFSGNMSAIVATQEELLSPDGVTPLPLPANIAFAPQRGVPIGDDGIVTANTSDPLLHDKPAMALWFDLPDMSTPIAANLAVDQAVQLSAALGRSSLMNDYAASQLGADVPMDTDWVVSQPTRRYHATVKYGVSADLDTIALAAQPDEYEGELPNPYEHLLNLRTTPYGTQACMMFKFSSTDREEAQVETSIDADFSPGTFVTNPYCGEVFTLSFSDRSPLGAVVTNRKVNAVGTEGWAHVGVDGVDENGDALRIPMVGFAATKITNQSTGVHFGWTLPHRWVD